jgi:peptide/nickel transport system substrate-binding protein
MLLAGSPAVASGSKELIIAKPFGPSVENPDPGKGSNGWYTSEAGVTETLFVLDFDMNLQPWLAGSFKNISPLIWQIQLKKGILFHDNTPLTARAVKWSIERIIHEKNEMFNKRIHGLLDIRRIIVQDEYTLTFETHGPNACFLYNLTSPETGILGPLSGKGKIFGTGPFVLEKVIPNDKMIVTGFKNYWGGKPVLDKVCLTTIKSPTTRMLAFESGQIDLAVNFPENDAARISSRKGVNIVHRPTARLCFFFVRVKDGPLADARVRKAVNYAINRREIVKAVLADVGGVVGASVFPEVLPWCNRALDPYPYDPEKALQLLEEVGARDSDHDGILELDGNPLCLNMWTYEARASLKPTLELVQAQLAKVGIGARLNVTKKSSPINRAMKKGEVDLNLQMWNSAPQGDPDYFISDIFTTCARSNFMGFHNPELDQLAAKARTTFDREERGKIYDRIQEIIFDQSPVIVLFHKSMVSALSDHVKNYAIHPAEKYLLTPRITKE